MNDGLHILVVDDRPDATLFLCDYLTARHHRAQATHSGMNALSLIQRKRAAADPYQLLFTALTMPEIDGLGLLHELKRRQESLPSVLLVDHPHEVMSARPEARALGCLAIFAKPVESALLDQLLAQVAQRCATTVARPVDEPFFGTTRMFRISRPSAPTPIQPQPAPPPLAMPTQPVRTPLPTPMPIAEEFTGEDSPPRAAVPQTVKVQNPLSDGPPRAPQAQVVRRERNPPPPDANGPETRIRGYERYPASAETPMPTPADAYRRRPSDITPPPDSSATGRVTRKRSEPGLPPLPPVAVPAAKPPGSSAFGRQVDPPATSDTGQVHRPPGAAPQQTTQTTTRMRRGLGEPVPGTALPQTALTPLAVVTVTCATCAAVFQAARKTTPYVLPCLTCGALNTVSAQ